ncbi:MAG TPA: cation-transporting P-type ATPase [Thermoplasmata archaeon]|jgi:magnesium-transporting ATPase (P-type)
MARVDGKATALLDAARRNLADLYRELRTGPEGLSAREAEARLSACGPNELPVARKAGVAERVILQLRNLFNVLLVFASALSFVIGFAYGDIGSLEMGIAIFAVVVFNIVFNLLQEHRAERVVEALRRLIPANAKATRAGRVAQVPIAQLVPGDLFSFDEGDRVPADARLVSSYGVTVDQSTLTGESSLRERSADNLPTADVQSPTDCPNILLAGTTVASGSGSAVVLATGTETVFGRIVAETREIKEAPSPLQRQLGKTARLNFAAAMTMGLLFLVISLAFRNLSLLSGLLIMIAVAIDLVPEGLQITVTLALALASVSMSKRNVVVKRLAAVETLGSSTVICTDKTGTITAGQMTVRKAWVDGTTFDVSGQGYGPEGQILLNRQKVSVTDRDDVRRLCEIAAFDNTATLTPPLDRRRQRWTAIGDTTDAALLVFSLKGGLDGKKALLDSPRIALLPFDATRKMMTSIHRKKDGRVVAYAKGAAQGLVERSERFLREGKEEPLTPEIRKTILDHVDRFAGEAFRVLALAYRILPPDLASYPAEAVEKDLTFVGLVAIHDPPRPAVAEAVLKARGAGIKVVMITGDHELTAEAIARRVGIITGSDHQLITGARLASVSDGELSALLDAPEIVFARTTPEQKHRIVKAFQAKGETVAVTGDGVNDAPALAEGDVGIAMGITGTDVARESADMVLLDDDFASIVSGVELGRGVFDNLKKFLVYVFGHNWAELMGFVAFVLLGTPVAIGVVQVLLIDLVMDIPPSLALTVEPPEPKVMERPPRGSKSRLFDLGALLTSAYVGVPVGIAAVLAGFAVWSRAGWTLGQPSVADPAIYAQGVAVVIAGIMMGQMGNALSRRSRRESAFALPLMRNRWFLPALAGTVGLLLASIYVPFFQPIFHTASLAAGDWAFVILLAPMVVALEEARKFVARRAFPIRVPTVPALAALTGLDTGLLPSVEAKPIRRVPAGMAAPPIVLVLFAQPASWSAIQPALNLAAYSGSSVLVARVLEGGDPDLLADLEGSIDGWAQEIGVSHESADVPLAGPAAKGEVVGSALRRLAEEAGAKTIVVPTEPATLAGKGPRWLEELASLEVFLVRPPVGAAAPAWPKRILIPVLRAFEPKPFDVAAAFTASSVVPEVDVVAARVIRMPAIVPLYSTYRPESLVDTRRELSFLAALRGRPLFRILSPRVLLVRDVGRDVVDFAAEHDVDTIVLKGEWKQHRVGFPTKEDRAIATKARCTVVVVLAASR